MIKAINVALDVLVAFSVWCGAIVMTVLTLHVLVIGGFTVYNLMHS